MVSIRGIDHRCVDMAIMERCDLCISSVNSRNYNADCLGGVDGWIAPRWTCGLLRWFVRQCTPRAQIGDYERSTCGCLRRDWFNFGFISESCGTHFVRISHSCFKSWHPACGQPGALVHPA